MGSAPEGIEHLRIATGLAPRDAFYHFRLADLLSRLGRAEEALDEFRGAVRCAPHDAYYRFRLAGACMAARRAPDAINVYRRLVEMAPGDRTRWVLLGDAYSQAGRPDVAEKMWACFHELDDYQRDFVARRRAEYAARPPGAPARSEGLGAAPAP
jgi:tetratricopeptide (TPR) repeat protein